MEQKQLFNREQGIITVLTVILVCLRLTGIPFFTGIVLIIILAFLVVALFLLEMRSRDRNKPYTTYHLIVLSDIVKAATFLMGLVCIYLLERLQTPKAHHVAERITILVNLAFIGLICFKAYLRKEEFKAKEDTEQENMEQKDMVQEE